MKYKIYLVMFVFICTFANEAKSENNVGYGLGHSYAGIGVRYDHFIDSDFYLSMNIGLGLNVGLRYKVYDGSDHDFSISTYAGKSYRAIGDSMAIDTSASIGLDYEYLIGEMTGMEFGFHYVNFSEKTSEDGYIHDGGPAVSIGINHHF